MAPPNITRDLIFNIGFLNAVGIICGIIKLDSNIVGCHLAIYERRRWQGLGVLGPSSSSAP